MIDDPEIPPAGIIPLSGGRALWRVWAPKAQSVELVLGLDHKAPRYAMTPEPRGFHSIETPFPGPGQRYAYSLDEGKPLPDPCSRWQPDGILEPSAVWFPDLLTWDERGWTGIERKNLVFYEIHVGTFTPEGTFDAVIPRIPDLLDLGITAIEIMPVGQFPGTRSWGYDGVHPFAVQNSYGGPDGLHRLVEACHQQGMAVFLDVVYNHFGPDGNMFPAFGDYLTPKTKTDWGDAVNFDNRGCEPVRAMVVENARSWIRDFHFDGLRLDAADQIYDRSPRHILADVTEAVHAAGDALGRRVHVFAETDMNDAQRYLKPPEFRGYALDGHWNDDFHHAVHVALTGERNGYYIDFEGPKHVAKVYSSVFVNDGRYSPFRDRRHGAPAVEFSGDRFVAFVQNHDQVGNRLHGDRYGATLAPSAQRLAAGLLLLAPRLPLLFMGEEYGESNPFAYFCDFENPELVEAVRRGRKAEFVHFAWETEPPDPVSHATRDAAVLSWSWTHPHRRGLRALYRDLLRLRRTSRTLRDFRHPRARVLGEGADGSVLEVLRGGIEPHATPLLQIYFNLSAAPQTLPTALAAELPSFRSEVASYGAPEPEADRRFTHLRPHEFLIFGPLEPTGDV